jgi:hypothetical protein
VLEHLPERAGDRGDESVNRLVPGYEGLTVAKVLPRLASLTTAQLHKLGDYERRHANRTPVLAAIDRLLA